MSPKLGSGEERKKKLDRQNYRRKIYYYETYSRALSKDCHFFLVFLLLVAPRTCDEHKKEIKQLFMPKDISRYYFTLSKDNYAYLDSWAKDDYYNNNPKYLYFSYTIRHLNTAQLEDF
jgi:hypothetical protein